jgi:hypothetical protein
MDNLQRRLMYARQRFGPQVSRDQVLAWITDGTEDAMLAPGQRRRIRHKRGSEHRPPQRERRRSMTALAGDMRAAMRRPRVVIDGTRISDLVPPASAPWAAPGADVAGDMRAAMGQSSAWDRRHGQLEGELE